jgi:hypothetical protein
VQQVIGQNFRFEQQLVDTLLDAEDYSGRNQFFDRTALYAKKKLNLNEYFDRWENIAQELKHRHRFFSQSALRFFQSLFADVDTRETGQQGIEMFNDSLAELANRFQAGLKFFRARA